MKNNRGSIVAGIVLIGLGLWFLAEQMGMRLPELSTLWPAFLIIFGLASLISYFADRNPERVFFGVAGPLLGAFFFAITLGPLEWRDLGVYWPVFILIFSLASVAQWIATPANRNLLSQAAVGLLIGLFFLAYNLNLLNRVLAQQILAFWPLILIVLGLIVVVRTFRRNET
jgi:hypothetical protein